MADHPGVARARQYFEAFNKGDAEALSDFFAEDVVWRVGGNHQFSGEYRGRKELFDYFDRVRQETAGSMSLEPESILASDDHTAVFARVRAQRGDKSMDVLLAQILENGPDGRWNEYWALADDQDAVNAFWS